MTHVDRTNEFKLIASSLTNGQKKIDQNQNTNQNVKNTISVNKIASQIAHDIYVTSSKLEELTKLSKSRSPFGDPGDRIQELTFLIKGDLNTIRQKVEHLENYVKGHSSNNTQIKTHSETLVNALQLNLCSTTKAFTDALEIRTKKSKNTRRKKRKSHWD